MGKPSLFGEFQEKRLVKQIKMQHAQKFPPCRDDVRSIAIFAEQLQLKHTFRTRLVNDQLALSREIQSCQ